MTSDGPPGLVATLESISAYRSWISDRLGSGKMTTKEAETFVKIADNALKEVRTAHGIDELANLRQLVQRAEAAAQQRKANDVKSRYAQTGDLTVGKWAAPEDKKGSKN